MFKLVPKFRQNEWVGNNLKIIPYKSKNVTAFNSAVYNAPYNKDLQKTYGHPTAIARLANQESLKQKPQFITDALDVPIKDKGSSLFYLPDAFQQCREFVQKISNFEITNTPPELYEVKSARLLLHYNNGYDSELPSTFHWDPEKPVSGALYNVFFATTILGTEYTLTPSPKQKDIITTNPLDVLLLNGCCHRKPYIPEGVERIVVSVITTVSVKDLKRVSSRARHL